MHNQGKGGTDTECKRLTVGKTDSNVPFHPRFTQRLFYLFIISTVRSYRVYKFVEDGTKIVLPDGTVNYDYSKLNGVSMRASRAALSASPLNDCVIDLMNRFRLSKIGSLQPYHRVGPSAALSTPKTIKKVITGALPDISRSHLRKRATRAQSKGFERKEFIPRTNIPLADNAESASTPGVSIYKNSYVKIAAGTCELAFL